MSFEEVERALDSLEGWPGLIGIIGGEPTIHPQFVEICHLIKKRGLKTKTQLFTMGGQKYKDCLSVIRDSFSHINYNPHDLHQLDVCVHQPITIAIQDVVENKTYRDKLIDECWAQRTWCPTIGPKGAFFCEIAYALDLVLDGEGGFPVEHGWWNKTPDEFRDQVDRYCGHCGFAIPMEREKINEKKEKMSSGLLQLFRDRGLPCLSDEDVSLFDQKLTIEEMERAKENWDPGNYRQDLRSDMKHGWKRREQPGGRYKGERPSK
jgi:hypothetical protein